MNILIVDDKQAKIAMLVQCLLSVGVERESIDVAMTGLDARKFLRQSKYDVMILDLVLPMRAEDPPEADGGIRLLDEIQQRDDVFISPSYIIGVTAHEDLASKLSSRFAEFTWSLLHTNGIDDDWLKPVKNLVSHISSVQSNIMPDVFTKDVCVITALRDPELYAIRNIGWGWSDPYPLNNTTDTTTAIYEGNINISGRNFTVVAASAHRMGMVAAGILATKLIIHLRPRVIVMAGICAGLPDETSIGDVILANPVWDWQSGKKVVTAEGSDFLIDSDHLDVDQGIVSSFETIIDQDRFWYDLRRNWLGERPNSEIKGHIGPVASSSSVIADNAVVNQIKKQSRKLLGIEMEAYGIYAAARSTGSPKPVALSIKSVCDFANEEKSDKYQKYAAYVSAGVTERFLEVYLPSIK